MSSIKILILLIIPFFLAANYQQILVNKYECDIKEIVDADTIKAEIIVPEFDVKIMNQTIRASDYDACEVSYRRTSVKITSEEVKIGKIAKEYLISLVKTYKVYIIPKGHDIYGRRLGILFISNDGINFMKLSDLMIERKFLREQL